MREVKRMKDIFISVVIFTYNRSHLLRRSIDSVLRQSYRNFELIIVNDGSTDNTTGVLSEIIDPRIIIFHKDHEGAPLARNLAIKEAKGEYILWMGDDDELNHDILTKYVSVISSDPSIDILYSWYNIYNVEKKTSFIRKYPDWSINRHLLAGELLFTAQFMDGGGLFRKKIYDTIGMYNPFFVRAQDYEFAVRVSLDDDVRLKMIPEALYTYYRYKNNTLTGDWNNKDLRYDSVIIDYLLSNKSIEELFPEDKSVEDISQRFIRISERYYQVQNPIKAFDYLKKALQLTNSIEVKKKVELRSNELSVLYDQYKGDIQVSEIEQLKINRYFEPFNYRKTILPFIKEKSKKTETKKSLLENMNNYENESNRNKNLDNNPEFSVIMANYNGEKYIAQAIESVLAQTFINWELIIIDDASKDRSVEIIQKYLKDPRIRLIQHQSNQKYIQALISGIEAMKSNIFGALDSDDALLPQAIEVMVNAHRKYPKAGYIYSQFMYCDAELKPKRKGYCNHISQGKSNLDSDKVSHFRTIKKNYYNQTPGYDRSVLHAEDKDISYKMEEVSDLVFIDEVLYLYRVLDESISHIPENRRKSLETMTQAKCDAIKRRTQKSLEVNQQALSAFEEGFQAVYQKSFTKATDLLNQYRRLIDYLSFARHDQRKSSHPVISVIVVCYQTNNDLIECLKSVLAQINDYAELIVVDNGGNDEVLAQILQMPLLYVRSPKNLYPSEGRNIGVSFAQGEIVAFLDDDGIVAPNFLTSIYQAFKMTQIACLRGKVLPKQQNTYDQYARHYNYGNTPFPHFMGIEGNSAFLKNIYIEVGGMNPLLFGGEGAELSFRIAQKYSDSSCIYWPYTVIYHDYANNDQKFTKKIDRHDLMNQYCNYLNPEYEQYLKYHRSRNKLFKEQIDGVQAIIFQKEIFKIFFLNSIKKNLIDHIERYIYALNDIQQLGETKRPRSSVVVSSKTVNADLLSLLKQLNKEDQLEVIFINNGGKNALIDDHKKCCHTYVILDEEVAIQDSRTIGSLVAMSENVCFADDDHEFHLKNPMVNRSQIQLDIDFETWEYKKDLYLPLIHSVERFRTITNVQISIIIIAWQYNDAILKNVQSLVRDQKATQEIIFVDNGAGGSVFEPLKQYVDCMIHLHQNTGAYLARNIGALFSESSILLFLDDDALALTDCVYTHYQLHQKYDIISLRGAVYPNLSYDRVYVPMPYYLGNVDFPIYADIEGNTSYQKEAFFKVGGWDDNIRYGGGGIELAIRLYRAYPDPCLQIYSPLPGIIHDPLKTNESKEQKRERQLKSLSETKIKHPDYDEIKEQWTSYAHRAQFIKLKNEIVINSHHSEEYRKMLIEAYKNHLNQAVSINDPVMILGNADKILSLNPLESEIISLLRDAEKRLGEGFLHHREEVFLKKLSTHQNIDYFALQAAQFFNSSLVMELLKKYFNAKRLSKKIYESQSLVSVIIPVYNSDQASIQRTLDSVFYQTFKNWEIIVIDDGSQNDSLTWIKQSIPHEFLPKVQVITQENQGVSLARNNGFKLCRGSYLCFLDCGDHLGREYFEEALMVLEQDSSVSWVYPITLQYGERNRFWSFHEFDLQRNLRMASQPVTSIMRRSFFEETGCFDIDFKYGYEDWALWVKAVRLGYKGRLIPKVLFFYHKVEESRSNILHSLKDKEYQSKLMIIHKNQECYKEITPELEALLKSKLRISKDIIQTQFETDITSKKEMSKQGKLRVQFYVYKNVHWPMFEQLYYYLRDREEIEEITICIPNLLNLTQDTYFNDFKKIVDLGTRIEQNPRNARADVTFIADTIAGKVKDCGLIINVGHGTISKGYYFTESIWTERENWVDLLCVPGDYAKQQFEKILRTKVVATGMPKLDPVFSGKYNKDYLCQILHLDEKKKIVLYAPTFNIDLSSAFNFVDRFSELASEDYYVLIKLHGSTVTYLSDQYIAIARDNKNILFIDDSNLAPYIGGADIMISDVSSAFMEFMALDKPVILYNNPNISKYHGYDPNNIEYLWRDLGNQVLSFDECKEVLLKLINDNDDGKSEKRNFYAQQLFSERNGKSSSKVWENVMELFQDKLPQQQIPVLSIVLYLYQNEFFIRNILHFIQFYSVLPIEVVLIANPNDVDRVFIDSITQYHELYDLKVHFLSHQKHESQAIIEGFKQCRGDYLIYLQDDGMVFKNFDYIIYKSFILNHDLQAFTCINNLNDLKLNYSSYIQKDAEMTFERFSYSVFNQYECTAFEPVDSLKKLPFIALKKDVFTKNHFNDIDSLIQHLCEQRMLKINLSLFIHYLPFQEKGELLDLWRSRFHLNNEMIGAYVKRLIDTLNQHSYSDLMELLIKIFIQTQAHDRRELIQIAYQSLFQRYYDVRYKKQLIQIFKDFPNFVSKLKLDLDMISKCKGVKDLTLPHQKKRVMLYYFKNVHIPILKPIMEELKKNKEIELAIGYMQYAPEIRAGFTPQELEIIASYQLPMYEVPQDFKADVTVIADSVYPWVQNCGKLVHIGHGILCKGQYYTNTETAQREEMADVVCVPGDYHADVMKQVISKPVIATGMAKLDALFDGTYTRESVLEHYQLPSQFKYLLFAPTFNDELSAIPFVMDRINEVLPDQKSILLIKLHGSTRREYVEMYQAMVDKDPRVIFVDELDITPFLALADLMISDVSSAMIEFASLGKPLILFNNPNWTSYKNYNPNDIEFKFREIGIQVRSLAEMKEAVRIAFQQDRKNFLPIVKKLVKNSTEWNATQKICEIIQKA